MGSTYKDFYHNACRERDALRAEISRRQTRIEELEAENARLSSTRPSEPVRAWCEKLSHLVGEMPLDLLHFDQRPVGYGTLVQAAEDDCEPLSNA